MGNLLQTLVSSSSGMKAQSGRLRLVAQNIANVDTPGFRRKIAPFETSVVPEGTSVRQGRVRLDTSPLNRIYDPSHPLADTTGHYMGSNVDLLVEVADARQAQRQYEANLKMFDQARQMTSRLFELLRN